MSAVVVPSLYVSRLSQLWVRKQLTYFRLYDTRRAGVVTNEGLRQVIMERAQGHFGPDKLPRLEPIVQHSWRIMCANPMVEAGVRTVHWPQFLHNRLLCVTEGAELEASALADMSDALLAAGEVSHGHGYEDGLALHEFSHLIALYGVGERDSKTSFKVLDDNQDGVVSKREFRTALSKFFFSPDKDESSMMFGHLAWDDIETEEKKMEKRKL